MRGANAVKRQPAPEPKFLTDFKAARDKAVQAINLGFAEPTGPTLFKAAKGRRRQSGFKSPFQK